MTQPKTMPLEGPRRGTFEGRGELRDQPRRTRGRPHTEPTELLGERHLLPDLAAFGVTSRLPLQSLPTLTLFDADNPAVVAASEMSLGST